MLFYVLECRVENCTAEFHLNDIPVIRRGPEIGDAFGGPVNHLIVDGINHIEIVVEPGPTPEKALRGEVHGRKRTATAPEAMAWAALCVYPKGAVLEGPDREELFSLEWKPEDGGPCFFPRVVGGTHDLGPVFGEWGWQKAERLALDDTTRQEAADFIISVHGGMVLGDFETYTALSDVRSREVDRCYEKPEGSTGGQVLAMKADCAQDPFWGMEQVRPDTFSLRLCGNDRLVDCVNESWKPVLEEVPDREDSVMRYPMMIGRVEGQWKVLR